MAVKVSRLSCMLRSGDGRELHLLDWARHVGHPIFQVFMVAGDHLTRGARLGNVFSQPAPWLYCPRR